MAEDGNTRPAQPPVTAPADKPRTSGWRALVKETALVVGTALVLSFLIKTFLAQAFFIPSESMEDTLLVNDRVMVSLLTPGPFELERGDVVVFHDPGGWLDPSLSEAERDSPYRQVLTFIGVLPQDSGEHLIKRIIGMPGDHVVCCDAQDRITVNGTPINEDYLPPGTVPSTIPFDVTVPENRVWVMGDNRGFSQDSRFHQSMPGQGSVSIDDVVGRAAFRFWPLNRIAGLSNQPEVFDPVQEPADVAP